MGIYHFFSWFRTTFRPCIKNVRLGVRASDGSDGELGVAADTLCIDMNALFHGSTQKVYRYGAFDGPPPKGHERQLQRRVHEDVCRTLNTLVALVRPKKRLILCVDGPAPYAKMVQQRKRRFKSAREAKEDASFDSNAITPGTKFMDALSRHIDWHIRYMVSVDATWGALEEVILSNEKSAGEGEAKIYSYLRTRVPLSESVVVHGADADLIMLSLGSRRKSMWVLRDDQYNLNRSFFLVDIDSARGILSDMLEWKSPEHAFDSDLAIDDFVFLCFLVGNDFLPHIPSLEIVESGVEIIMEAYRRTCRVNGHICTRSKASRYTMFNSDALASFFNHIASFEEGLINRKIENSSQYFPDELLEIHSAENEFGEYKVDADKYRKAYTTKHFPDPTMLKEACEAYLEGMDWVMTYYKKGPSSWVWYYPFSHAPLAEDLANYLACSTLSRSKLPVAKPGSRRPFNKDNKTRPMLPFMQLLAVLPPKSNSLLPFPLNKALVEGEYASKHCPEEFDIDLAGKRNDWQGVVMLPNLPHTEVERVYNTHKDGLSESDSRRNRLGRDFVYSYNPRSTPFQSSIGEINPCFAQRRLV